MEDMGSVDNPESESKIPKKKSIIFLEPTDSSYRVQSKTSSGNTTSIKRFIVALSKQRNEVKVELSKLCEGFNLLIFMLYVLFCINWYLLGVQWFPDRLIVPELECHIKDLENSEWSFYEKRNITSPKDELYVPGCVYYNVNYSQLKILTYDQAAVLISKVKDIPIVKCKNYSIKFDVPKEISFQREFKIYCLKKTLLSSNSYGHFGLIVFGFPCGILADIHGRRPVYFICSIISSVSAFILTCSPNFIMLALAKFFLLGSLISVNLALSIIYSEIYRHQNRSAATVVSFSFMIIGITFTSFQRIFNFIEVWRLRSLAFAFSVLILLFGIMIVPESPRYLINNRQFNLAWKVLQELGDDENPDAEDFLIPKPTTKFQLKVLSKRYLQRRIYVALFLNGIATILHSTYLNMRKSVVLPQNEILEIEMLLIQILLFIATGVTSVYYSKKLLISTYYLLLCLSIFVHITAESEIVRKISSKSGFMFIPQINILVYTYLLEIIPTTHRATSLGLFFSINYISEGIAGIFQEELSWHGNFQQYSIYYCAICIICVLVTILSPNHGSDLPDRKHDLSFKLSLEAEIM